MINTVGIVGGGIMGCLAAIGYARAGKRVVLFDRRDSLMSGASRGNEGKIHLGFTYGLDRSGDTRKVMLRYGLKFAEAARYFLDADPAQLFLYERQHYAVHRDSALSDEGVAAHMHAIAADLAAAGVVAKPDDAVRRISARERQAIFSDSIRDAWEVSESTIECATLVRLVRAAVAATPGIELRLGTHVEAIGDDERPVLTGIGGKPLGRFDLVINAGWEGMPRLEHQAGAALPQYCLRAKLGFMAPIPEGMPPMPTTVIYGTFGDIVPHPGGLAYLSWYPRCLMGFTTDLDNAHSWYDGVASGFDMAASYRDTCAAFTELVPAMRAGPEPDHILGGPILAVAETDIPDLDSKLHQRKAFGFHRRGNVIAIDTGKLTAGPGLAQELMELTLG